MKRTIHVWLDELSPRERQAVANIAASKNHGEAKRVGRTYGGLKPGDTFAWKGEEYTVRSVGQTTQSGYAKGFADVKTTTGKTITLKMTSDADGAAAAYRIIHGMTVGVESPKGTMRSGPGWSVVMPADYGYIHGTVGADGDSLDCYVAGSPSSPMAYVADQDHLDRPGVFDEHKVIFGCRTKDEATAVFRAGHHKADKVLRAMSSFHIAGFKKWMKTADLRQPCRRVSE